MNLKSIFIPIKFFGDKWVYFFFYNGGKIMAIKVGGFFVDTGDIKSNAIEQQESKSIA